MSTQPRDAGALLSPGDSPAPSNANPKLSVLDDLSERELEITSLLSKGLNTKEIAHQLNISEHTVSTHRKLIIRKTGCRNTTHLVAVCLRKGMI